MLHTKSRCMAAIFTFSKSSIKSLAKVGVHVWIKQHLRIKKLYGTTENAVKTQIWIAIAVYVLVAIVKKRLNTEASLYTILQILSLTLFEKTPLEQLLKNMDLQMNTSQDDNQLNLFN